MDADAGKATMYVRRCTVPVANHLTAVLSTKGGKVETLKENERIVADMWVTCREGIRRCA